MNFAWLNILVKASSFTFWYVPTRDLKKNKLVLFVGIWNIEHWTKRFTRQNLDLIKYFDRDKCTVGVYYIGNLPSYLVINISIHKVTFL